MPFPWKKKNRVTRISQLVADLQFQSPKHGGSLVVETGFPTSLIDLFVKNRSRFKKPRFKKPLRTEISDPPPPPPPPSPSTSPPPITELLIPDSPPAESPSPLENTDGAAAATVTAPVTESGSVSRPKAVIAKILTVMVLVAIVKWFTVGITVSAFALVFLEFAAKRVVLYLRPCSDAIVGLERFQKVLFKGTVENGGDEIENELSVNLTCDEIEVVEAKSELGIDDYDDSLVSSECKIRGSRSGRFKSKMVKLMKFRGSKKEKKESKSESEVSSVVEEEEEEEVVKLSSFEIEEEEVKSLRGHQIKLERYSEEEGKNEVDCGITCSQELEIVRVGNSGYTILVIIVLFGLIVGRLPALILTIVWCLLVKIFRVLWKSHNVISIKCSVPKNS